MLTGLWELQMYSETDEVIFFFLQDDCERLREILNYLALWPIHMVAALSVTLSLQFHYINSLIFELFYRLSIKLNS